MELAAFNAMTEADASATASVWAAIPRWVEAVISSRPYSSVDDLADTAAELATQWTNDDLDQALAHHPRIGERPDATGAEAEASAREQASMSSAADDVASRITAGNAAYEARFGRVFLIRAAGRSPQEMLSELERRLGNDDGTEMREAIGQLAQIALLRLSADITPNEGEPS